MRKGTSGQRQGGQKAQGEGRGSQGTRGGGIKERAGDEARGLGKEKVPSPGSGTAGQLTATTSRYRSTACDSQAKTTAAIPSFALRSIHTSTPPSILAGAKSPLETAWAGSVRPRPGELVWAT